VNSNFGFRNAKTKDRYMIHDSRYMIPERSMEFRKVDISWLLDAVGCASFARRIMLQRVASSVKRLAYRVTDHFRCFLRAKTYESSAPKRNMYAE
jgi:hypothetical protein